MDVTTPLRRLDAQLDRLVEHTPADRERTVDALRAFSIVVVVVWHWSLSVLHRGGGDERLVMPNPIHEVPLGWLATWLLQVMPLFFVVGGFANLAGWDSVRADGGGWREFYARRAHRLLTPLAVFLGVWAAVELVGHVAVDGYRTMVVWGEVNLMPLWFVGAYLWVVALVPLTARLHRRGCELTLVGLGALVVVADLVRFQFGLGAATWVNTALVWVFAHQLGYFYGDGRVLRWPVRRRLALGVGALTALVVLTSLDVYPRSMVALAEADLSHMYPTTAGVAVLAVFQLAVVLLLRPWLEPRLREGSGWRPVVAVNAVIMTIFLWHMTALLLAIGAYEVLGFELLAEPTLGWWLQRPLWILAPGAFLVLLVAAFHRVEVGTGTGRRAES